MDSMNSSPMETLAIDSVGLESRSWTEVSAGLRLPHLTKLVLSVPEFDFRDLLAFLSRQSALEDLTLLDSPANLGGNVSGLALPKLRTLTCPPRTLVAILASSIAVPKSCAIAIRPEERQNTICLRDWTYALRAIGTRQFANDISIALILGTADCAFPAQGQACAVGALEQVEDIIIDVRHSEHLQHNVPDYLRTWLSSSTLPNCGLVIIQSQRKRRPSRLYHYIMDKFPSPDVDVMEE
ncbi:hypothetical protein GLOTRDRAFT_129494 [Gloeophyllum trabeum ATCC 11539]|uniref:F-box domain-containing protein n=1 Tax=Gloeophyllum trabeum (strain ATCC 11539 / FP-39264 / Madison 617) TaxID=670483 RepID=S7RLD2_GLOTA|nr:uncharacterized protein GLOTRDRAFT_129494 [Gloeophyllum trabeum ATCC 11539]EPQ55205.1 hypothetical protein GLOTRDRAFT_129494 [Gloeophyllum trabeum ATCC 11539]